MTTFPQAKKIQRLEETWQSMMEAKDESGRRKFEHNLAYQKQVHALRVQIEDLKAAEAGSRQTLSDAQVAQLGFLDRLQGARDASGKRVAADISQKGQLFMANIDKSRQKIYAGGVLSDDQINNTLAECVKQNIEVSEYVAPKEPTLFEKQLAAQQSAGPGSNLPPPSHYHGLPQLTSPKGGKA